VFKGLKHYL